ncbi:MAG: hypothetical protein IPQ18_12710 [Saprospiraceae bacterium]|nr:hypothetical protein [Saprospiraceae bacterium]
MRRRYDDGLMPNTGSDRRSIQQRASTNGTVTGGCEATLTRAMDAAPNACGGTANVTVTVGTTSASGCDITSSCVRTFTVLPAPEITFVCGEDMTTASCQTQATIDAAYTAWVSTNGTVTGWL